MNKLKNVVWLGILILIVFKIIGFGKYEGESAEYWFNMYDEQEAKSEELQNNIDDYQSALEDANNNIDEANSTIEKAKRTAWESYDDMGNALDNLYTVDTISEP